MISESISKLISFKNLTQEEAVNSMNGIMSGKVSEHQIASFLTASRMKEVTSSELTGFLRVMKEKVNRIQYSGTEPLIDIVGTGGAKFKTFNVSTTASLLLSTLGVSVAKHGNRSFTSKSGSADLLEALGFNIEMENQVAEDLLNKENFTFLYAPNFHPAMKYVGPVRRSLGIRTVFNLLGPLTNPAFVKRQLIGVFESQYIQKFLEVFRNNDYENAMVVHGNIGADEIVTCGSTEIGILKDGEIKHYILKPEDIGIQKANPSSIANIKPQAGGKKVIDIFRGEQSELSDFIAVNAAAGLMVADKVDNFKEGIELAYSSMKSGNALDKLEKLIKESGGNYEYFLELIK